MLLTTVAIIIAAAEAVAIVVISKELNQVWEKLETAELKCEELQGSQREMYHSRTSRRIQQVQRKKS